MIILRRPGRHHGQRRACVIPSARASSRPPSPATWRLEASAWPRHAVAPPGRPALAARRLRGLFWPYRLAIYPGGPTAPRARRNATAPPDPLGDADYLPSRNRVPLSPLARSRLPLPNAYCIGVPRRYGHVVTGSPRPLEWTRGCQPGAPRRRPRHIARHREWRAPWLPGVTLSPRSCPAPRLAGAARHRARISPAAADRPPVPVLSRDPGLPAAWPTVCHPLSSADQCPRGNGRCSTDSLSRRCSAGRRRRV